MTNSRRWRAAGGAGIALGEVVRGDPHFLLGQAAATDVDLGQRVGRVTAVRVLLDELLELLGRLDGEALVLLDRLELIVVAHGQAVLHEVGDLMARVEGEEGLELLHRLVELRLAVEGLADQKARPRRPRGVRVSLDDLAECLSSLDVAPALQLRLALRVQLVGGQDRGRRRTEPGAAAGGQQQGGEQESGQGNGELLHGKIGPYI
jgi:hypothetical protein